MKTLRFVSMVVLAAMVFIGGVLSSDAHAQFAEFLGNACWSFFMTDGSSGRVEIGLQHMGDPDFYHYMLSGLFVTTTAPAAQSYFTGSAEVFPFPDNVIFMNLTRSRLEGPGMTSSVVHIVLDLNTFNGTIDESITYSDPLTSSTVLPEFSYRQGDIVLGGANCF